MSEYPSLYTMRATDQARNSDSTAVAAMSMLIMVAMVFGLMIVTGSRATLAEGPVATDRANDDQYSSVRRWTKSWDWDWIKERKLALEDDDYKYQPSGYCDHIQWIDEKDHSAWQHRSVLKRELFYTETREKADKLRTDIDQIESQLVGSSYRMHLKCGVVARCSKRGIWTSYTPPCEPRVVQ